MSETSVILDWTGRPAAYSSFYEGTANSRHHTNIPLVVGDSKSTLTPLTRKRMLGYARFFYANVGFAKGGIDDRALYSVGNGINLRSLISDPEIRALYDAAWDAWKYFADFFGIFHFDTMQDLASRAIDVDGDLGGILTENEEGEARVQMIEGHRIDDCGKSDSCDGVLLAPNGQNRAFRIRVDTPTGFTEIPADRFIHLFDAERFDERRGKTALHHAIKTLRHRIDILGFEQVAVQWNSAIAAAIETTSGEVGPGLFGNPQQKTTAGGEPITLEQLRAGAIPRLKPGEKIWTHKSDRPSSTFGGFLDYLDRDVALGLGIPVQFLHCADMGGTPQRFVMRKAERKFSQRAMLIARFVRRVRFYWAAKEIQRGALPFVDDWWKVRPEFPATASVDIGREGQQNREDLRFGNRTLQMDAGEQGLDWREDIRAQRQDEAKDLIDRIVATIKYAKEAHNLDLDYNSAKALLADGSNGNLPIVPTTAAQEDLKK